MAALSLPTVATADIAQALADLNSNQGGLSTAEARRRQATHGANLIPPPRPPGLTGIFIRQFNNALIWILLAAAGISWLLSRLEDSLVILLVLVLNAVIGTYQEYKASRILADLNTLAVPQAIVKRDGMITAVPATNVVIGDIVIVEAGNHVPADCRLLLAPGVTANESPLTGESRPVAKQTERLATFTTLTKASNCLFMGTTVVGGRSEAVVYATGLQTQLGAIAHQLAATQAPTTPLQQQIAAFTRQAIIIIGLLISALFGLGVLAGTPLTDMFITAITLAVAAIPEGLPVLITIVLVLGVRKMAADHALVQQQLSIETLGQVQILLTDKTGTLTQNILSVSAVCLPHVGRPRRPVLFDQATLSPFTVGLKPLINACWLANNSTANQSANHLDDPVDRALARFARHYLTTPNLKERHPRQFELPFDSDRKFMATFHRQSSRNTIVYLKGAARPIFEYCQTVPHRAKLQSLIRQQARAGDKVIVTAEAIIPTQELARVGWQVPPLLTLLRHQATLTGIVFLNDPLRPESASTIARARAAGVRVVMATGDNAHLAAAVGERLGLTGTPQTTLPTNQAALYQILKTTDIFAEVTPSQKLSLVKTWQSHGYTVAMTGDGVNDAPALKLADVGLAMGRRGTDIARDAADIIMLDDNLATIVTAIASGRTIFRNIQRVIAYLLASNLAEILVLFLTVLTGGWLPLPLLPAQILWVNLITDSITVIPLAIEPDHEDSMTRPPRRRRDPLLSPAIISNMYAVTGSIVVITLAVFAYFWFTTYDLPFARTTAFFTLATVQAFNLLNARSAKTSIFTLGLHTNPAVLASLVGAVTLSVLILYLPLTQNYLQLTPLSGNTVVSLILISSSILWLIEIKKQLAGRVIH